MLLAVDRGCLPAVRPSEAPRRTHPASMPVHFEINTQFLDARPFSLTTLPLNQEVEFDFGAQGTASNAAHVRQAARGISCGYQSISFVHVSMSEDITLSPIP